MGYRKISQYLNQRGIRTSKGNEWLNTQVYSVLKRDTYSKHILNWVGKRLPDIDPRECDLEYVGTPTVSPIDHQEMKDFTEGCLNDD